MLHGSADCAGRLLPELEPAALVPAWDLYNRVSGAVRVSEEPLPEPLVARYRSGHDLAVLDEIRAHQIARLSEGSINRSISKYWWRHASHGSVVLRKRRGEALMGRVPDWREVFLRVGEVEDFIRREMPAKLPDVEPFRLADGSRLYPFDLLFLQPLNDRVESRDYGILDVDRYFAVGRVPVSRLQDHLGGAEDNLFSRYGETEGKRGDEARLPARAADVLGRPGAWSFGPTLWSTSVMTRRTAGIGGWRS